MKGRWWWIVIAANLLVLVGLAFVYPHLMVSPGPLVPAHRAMATDCFACHAPWRGATAERCIACHTVADIGLRSTKGVAIAAVQAGPSSAMKRSFHQELIEQDCMACHSDHAGPKLTQSSRKPFSHALLRPATRERCEACHAAPADSLHRQLDGGCASCHQAAAWKPATFDHDQRFLLDKDHNASCVTCHSAQDYSRYSCYGCHEHTPAKVRAKHVKEGIQNFEDCVQCHRSADAEPERGGAGEVPRTREGRQRD